MKTFKLSAMAVALGSSVLAAAPAQAAYVGAESWLSVNQLVVLNSSTGAPATGITVDTSVGSRSATASVTYNGATDITNDIGGPTDTVDPSKACAGNCGALPAVLAGVNPNNTTYNLASGAGDFGYSDARVSGSALAGGAAGFTRSDLIGQPTVIALGAASILNNVEATTQFTAATTQTIKFAASWTGTNKAFADPGGQGSVSATAATQFQLTLYDCGTDVVNPCTNFTQVLKWSAVDSTSGINAWGANNGTNNNLDGSGASADYIALSGHRYQLTINQTSNTNIRAVPEPATLALLGLSAGLMGLFARRRVGA